MAATSQNSQASSPTDAIVVGNGWAALATVGFLVQKGSRVTWVSGTGSRPLSALPGMESSPGVEGWAQLAKGFGIEIGEPVSASFLREFRNKAFREPTWNKAPTPEARQEVLTESLWSPEQRLAPLWETRFTLSVNEIDARIRALLYGDAPEGASWRAQIRRIEGLSVISARIEAGQIQSITLASGEELACEQIYFADTWGTLPTISGLPKNLTFIRGRHPISLLQATLTHSLPLGAELVEGFFGSLPKEAGEQLERHVWGHFSSDGLHSYWTLGLTSEEVEDNHQIAKKLRRMKNTLDKMFAGSSWLPESKPEFMSHVSAEQVRLQDSVLFSEGEVPAGTTSLPGIQGLSFLTDGCGPASSMIQVLATLGLVFVAEKANPQAENENSADALVL